jgi:hypothetical protein
MLPTFTPFPGWRGNQSERMENGCGVVGCNHFLALKEDTRKKHTDQYISIVGRLVQTFLNCVTGIPCAV